MIQSNSGTVGNCPDEDIMQNLKIGFSRCTFIKGKLCPCKYHVSRANSIIFTTTDNGGCKPAGLFENKFMSPLLRSPETDLMIRYLSEGNNLAGSWWMVKEQREWLFRHLVAILSEKRGEICNILVSGVAGYAHFYSYLHIVFDAAKEAGFDVSALRIDVIDSCITPILEIASIEKQVRNEHRLRLRSKVKKHYDIFGFPIAIPATNRKFINEMIPDIRKCCIRTLHCDVMHIADYRKEMTSRYDIITEHFLLSMIENEHKIIEGIRKSYSTMMKSGGHLLAAGGFSSLSDLNNIIEIHKKSKMTIEGSDNIKVWDPYGLSVGQLQDITNNPNKIHQITLDNYLIDFTFRNS